ncbi:MAG: hypothetical protein MUE81_09835 [Thermoflexibacter sp.]|jgi:hypothetical protein|nr:hypothetical protein [Thermoflexibacter sp.]
MNIKVPVFLIVFLLFTLKLSAQTPGFTYSGQLGVTGDFYRMNATGGEVRPRRPDEMFRFMGSGSIGVKGINIPFSVMLSNNQRNINTPIPTDQNLIDFIVNPVNSVGFAPTFKFGKVTLGTYVPKFTSYTSGDIRVFGAGLDALFNKKWRVAFHAGNGQIPVSQNLPLGVQGAYTRRVYTGKVGYGEDNGTHLHFAMMKVTDIVRSVPEVLGAIPPSDNIVLSVSGRWKINDQYSVEGEAARSGFTDNTLANQFEGGSGGLIRSMLPINVSSRLGTAAKLSINQQGKNFSSRIYVDYMTEGFRSLGYPFLQPDQINYRFEPRVNLMGGKVAISGAIGQRVNNVSELKGSKTTQLTGMLNVNWQATEKLSLAASYNNFGFRSTVRNDTLRVENVNQSINFTPTYSIPTDKYTHVITGSASFDIFNDYNLITGRENSNNSNTYLGSYILTFNQKPLNIDFTVMQFTNKLPTQEMRMRSATAGVSYQFMEKKMSSGLKLTLMENSVDKLDPSRQVMTQITYKYNVLKKLTFGMNGSINLFRFGTERPGVRFQESLLSTSLNYTIK